MYLIYKHTSPSGKSYIGYTRQGLLVRWSKELNHSKYLKNNFKLDRAIRKYPNKSQWKHEILINNIPTLTEAKNLEIICIFYYDTFVYGYNSTRGGDGSLSGWKHTKESKNKMSKIHKGKPVWNKGKTYKSKPCSKETKIKISIAQKGKKASEETKRKMSDSRKNRIGTMKGKHHSEKTKNKLSTLLSKITWKIIYPSGQENIIKSLNKFCKENKLHATTMCQVAKGKLKQHKGFKCEKLCI